MLHLDRAAVSWIDRCFRDLPAVLRPDDLLVFNNTRVFPARLFARRSGQHAQAVGARNPAAREFLRGRVEVLLTRRIPRSPDRLSEHEVSRDEGAAAGETWQALVRPGRKI